MLPNQLNLRAISRVTAALVAGLVAVGCAGEDALPRVPLNPTAGGALPDAILGAAPQPQGTPVNYVPGDTASTGYLALPEGEGPFPALLLIHEWNGLVDRVRQVADAFAAEGYVALAVDIGSLSASRSS